MNFIYNRRKNNIFNDAAANKHIHGENLYTGILVSRVESSSSFFNSTCGSISKYYTT